MDNNSKQVDWKSISIQHLEEHQDKEKTPKKEAPSIFLHVLVVDDEPFARDVVTQYLNVDGHTFETATNGEEGLEKFHQGSFDLIITDNAMPGMKGIQLANLIKQVAPEIPVIMLTARATMDDVEQALCQGADDYITKPFDPMQLGKDIREKLQKIHEARACSKKPIDENVPVSGNQSG